MSYLNSDWYYAFEECFDTDEEVIKFIFKNLNAEQSKKELLYDFMMNLIDDN